MRQQLLSTFLFYLLISSFISCKKDQYVPFQPTVVPTNISELYETKGDLNSDTVFIALQGGPVSIRSYDIESSPGYNYPFFEDDLRVYPYQVQHMNESFKTATNFTHSDAVSENLKTVKIVHDVIKHFKSQGKVVYLIGHSFGAFISQEVLYQYGTIAERTIVLNGRLDMDTEVWKGYARGEGWGFDANGLNPSLKSDQQGDREGMNMSILAAGLGFHRYTQRLANVDLTKSVFLSCEDDKAVGRWTDTEKQFITNKIGSYALSIPDIGHNDIFEPILLSAFYYGKMLN